MIRRLLKKLLGREARPAQSPVAAAPAQRSPARAVPPPTSGSRPKPIEEEEQGGHSHSHSHGHSHDHGHADAPAPAPAPAAAPARRKITIQIHDTPNPNSVKFVVGLTVVEKGSLAISTLAEAEGHPFAVALMGLPGVKTVFAIHDFVTVTKEDAGDWDILMPAVIEILTEAFSVG